MENREGCSAAGPGVLLDCSRGAAYNLRTLKEFTDVIAQMGYVSLQLYCEDMYGLEGEPYFGYLRGRYSAAEIRELDAYAAERGVELIPCIQTLAHLSGIFRWAEYDECHDIDDILLVGSERTYALIEKMFAFCAKNFRSRRINIGMDEAHRMGLGKYLDRNGPCDRFTVLRCHLERVCALAERYGFAPMMWSDMFFSLANRGNYYGPARPPSADSLGVPSNLKMIYWDYERRGYEGVCAMLRAHRAFGRETVFAGGAWAWYGFVPHNAYSMEAARDALRACADNGVRNTFVALWKDDGAESSVWSVLPALWAAAEYSRGNFGCESLAQSFRAQFGIALQDFLCADAPDALDEEAGICNPCKYMLYADPFLGIFDRTADSEKSAVFAKMRKKLVKLCGGRFGYMFRTLADLCAFMEIKYALGVRVRAAYRTGDREKVRALLPEFSKAERRLRRFMQSFSAQWERECKPFGFEKHDIRLGGLLERLGHCRRRLAAYAGGKADRIEELEEDILPYKSGAEDGKSIPFNDWLHTAAIKPEL